MPLKSKSSLVFALLFAFAASVAVYPISMRQESNAKDEKKQDHKNKVHKAGQPILWQEPTDLASRNLFWGPGGENGKPDLSQVTLIEEKKGGYSTKFHVKDGAGRQWTAKLGKEVQSEVAAVRIMWALGYSTEDTYYVPEVRIEGKGTFTNVEFKGKPAEMKERGNWSWDSNPFEGTPEFNGLKIMMLLMDNWDIKEPNNKIFQAAKSDDAAGPEYYVVSDLGATFGKTGGALTRSRNDPADYQNVKLIGKVKGQVIDFNYSGKRKDLFRDLTVDQAAWMCKYLTQLSDAQIRDAFKAANYSPAQIQELAQSFEARVNRLVSATGGPLEIKVP